MKPCCCQAKAHDYEICKGCRPVILDAQSKHVLPEDHPVMMEVLARWKELPLVAKRAWHTVCCHNSRDVSDMAHYTDFCMQIAAIVKRSSLLQWERKLVN